LHNILKQGDIDIDEFLNIWYLRMWQTDASNIYGDEMYCLMAIA
jgi:hypothetical protein